MEKIDMDILAELFAAADEQSTVVSKLSKERSEFSVCQFFEDGTYEYVRRLVDLKTAVDAFMHYTTSVGAKLGMTKKVIIIDGGDFINMEWQFGKGIVFPVA
jgi:hypothetical protein